MYTLYQYIHRQHTVHECVHTHIWYMHTSCKRYLEEVRSIVNTVQHWLHVLVLTQKLFTRYMLLPRRYMFKELYCIFDIYCCSCIPVSHVHADCVLLTINMVFRKRCSRSAPWVVARNHRSAHYFRLWTGRSYLAAVLYRVRRLVCAPQMLFSDFPSSRYSFVYDIDRNHSCRYRRNEASGTLGNRKKAFEVRKQAS